MNHTSRAKQSQSSLLHRALRRIAVLVLLANILLVLSPVFPTVPTAQAAASWYNTDWQYRKKITIDNTKVSGSSNFTNFPVLINRTDADWKSVGNGGKVEQADGGDILFTASGGMTKLDHEIETYDPATGELVAWVEVPTLDVDDDTEIYIYYGNSTGVADQENPTGVWASNSFEGVWHMSEDPSGSAPQMSDSTGNGNNGTSQGVMTSGDQVSGKLDGSVDFDGSDDYINVGTKDLVNGEAAMTASAWVWLDSTDTSGAIIDQFDSGAAADHAFMLYYDLSKLRGLVSDGTTSGCCGDISDSALDTDTWVHVAMVWSASSGVIRGYVNGVQQSATVAAPLANLKLTVDDGVQIGGNWNMSKGKIDEARVVSAARSSDWILTEYNNQNSPGTFYSVAVEETESFNVTVTESGDSTDVTEGGTTDTYTVVLSHAPSDNVVVTAASQNTSTGVTVSPSTLTFTTDNWDTAQTVTVTAVDDSVANEGLHTATITHSIASADGNYDGITVSSAVANITDNDDTIGPIISDISSSNRADHVCACA